ncbi:winged helix-turn-helix transcriptional regulator [Clostridium sp. 19966]|uniref:ArsR/SmtB family transcription factor n=1 Tax=Clostridium sp. 19966 TaxID=2768166 RepID=UPI0028DE470D|nr:metalloregulator ArsR/SmtB family transcription factor [Clostridium sp. 19966]MDT8717925.1 winged helix-turn-helix transcriptional regulator [Clostridium sp. 19966]
MKLEEKVYDKYKVEFIYSPYFEMMCSLHVLSNPHHHLEKLNWASNMKEKINKNLYDKIIKLSSRLDEWMFGMNLCDAGEKVNDLNIMAAIDYLLELDINEFMYFFLGREADRKTIKKWIIGKEFPGKYKDLRVDMNIFKDAESFRREFIFCIKEYYYSYFEKELKFIEPLLIRTLRKHIARCETIGLLKYIDELHPRIEIGEEEIYFHKYTKFNVNISDMEIISIRVSSFIDPHLLIDITDKKHIELTIRAHLEQASEVVPIDLSKTMKALGDETRLRILKCIYASKASTQSIAKEINVSEAGVSKQLKLLYEADLLYKQREGNYMYYYINKMTIDRIPMDIYQFIDK